MQYTRMWTDCLLFQVAARLSPCQMKIHVLLSFIENKHCKSNITNYLSVIRAFHIIHGLNTNPFKDERIQLFLKSLQIAAPLITVNRPTLDVEILQNIVIQCQSLSYPIVFKTLYLAYFFSFLRLSNILPHSTSTFDHTRQLACGNFIGFHTAVLLLKWSKTVQVRKMSHTIPLSMLGASPLCPIAALTSMIQQFVVGPNDPLFCPNQAFKVGPLNGFRH